MAIRIHKKRLSFWQKLLKLSGYFLLLILVFLLFGPKESVDMPDTPTILGDDLDEYLETSEARFDDITPNTKKTIIWANDTKDQTPIAIVYLHGFSATHRELAPVPQELAKSFGANLYLSRLKGHGRTGESLAEASAQDWLVDLQEALEIGKKLGERTLIMSASTGGTLAAIGSMDDQLAEKIDGIIFVSPNFAINNPLAPLLTLGGARYWVPLVGGKTRSWEPINEEQATYWTTSYPSTAVFPVAALVKKARNLDYSALEIPAFFYYSELDTVVDARATLEIADIWRGDVEVFHPSLSEDDDPSKHIIAGDIASPNQTSTAIELMQDWINRNMIENAPLEAGQEENQTDE